MALGQCHFFAPVHSGPQLVNAGVWNFRDGQIAAFAFIYEVDIPELITGKQRTACRLHVFPPAKIAVRHIKERTATQLLAGSQRVCLQGQLVYLGAVRQQAQGLVFLNAGQNEIAGPVDRAVPAGAGIGKADDPLDMGRILFQEPDAHGNRPALGIARKDTVKGHPVQFQIFVPAGACHQRQDFGFIQAGAVAHNAMEPTIQKDPEVQAAIVYHGAAVMVTAHEGVCYLAGDHL